MTSSLFAANPYKQPWLLQGAVFEGGASGEPVGDALQAHCNFCADNGLLPVLPPWPITLDKTLITSKLVGIPGLSRINIPANFQYRGFNNQFIILNRNFSQVAGNEYVYYRDFACDYLPPTDGPGFLGVGGVSGGLIAGLRLIGRPNPLPSLRPRVIGALIDLYAACRDVEVRENYLANITGAWGLGTPISADGGACIWVRNLTVPAVGADPVNATERCNVHHNTMIHMTSDEVLALFGVFGIVRQCTVAHNKIICLPSFDGKVHHARALSFFPLGLGPGAAVYDNTLESNYIEDANALYAIVDFGNSADAAFKFYNNKSRGNIVRHVRTPDIRAAWVEFGSPGPDPNVASVGIVCTEGTFGLAYITDTSGNASENDSFFCIEGGVTINTGFAGWQSLLNPTCAGSIFTGCGSIRQVLGGSVEAFGRNFYNCRAVNGAYYRLNGADQQYKVFDVDAADGEAYEFKNSKGVSLGGFARVQTGVLPQTRVSIIGVTSVVQLGTLVQNDIAGLTVVMQGCSITGGFGSITAGAGAGTVIYSLNQLGGLTNYFGPNGLPITFRTPAGDILTVTESGGVPQIGFFNKPAVAQGTTAGSAAALGGGGGAAISELTTYDGYTLPQVVRALRLFGLLL